MRRFVRFIVPSVLALVLAGWAFPAGATHNADRHDKMDLLFTSPNSSINSDLAFWGKYAVHGYYRNDRPVGGFRIFDIFFFNGPATTEIYTLSLHDALPI